jgi:hypothetical protein
MPEAWTKIGERTIRSIVKGIPYAQLNEIDPDVETTEVNQGHYSEFLDHSWVAVDYIYQFLGSHSLLRKENWLRNTISNWRMNNA